MLQLLTALIYGESSIILKLFLQTESWREGGDKEQELANSGSFLSAGTAGRLHQETS